MGVILSAFLLPKMAYWGDLGRFLCLCGGSVRFFGESDLDAKETGKNGISGD